MATEAPKLKEYKVLLNNVPTTVLLTEEDYERQGWVPEGEYARQPTSEERHEQKAKRGESDLIKSRTPANKARDYEGGTK